MRSVGCTFPCRSPGPGSKNSIAARPLGVLVTDGASGLGANTRNKANTAPFVRTSLERNPVWQEVESGAGVLVVFRAEEAYISPNWYRTSHSDLAWRCMR